jgi:hypothetical protein
MATFTDQMDTDIEDITDVNRSNHFLKSTSQTPSTTSTKQTSDSLSEDILTSIKEIDTLLAKSGNIKTNIKNGIKIEIEKIKGYAKTVNVMTSKTSNKQRDMTSDVLNAIKNIKDTQTSMMREIKEMKTSQTKQTSKVESWAKIASNSLNITQSQVNANNVKQTFSSIVKATDVNANHDKVCEIFKRHVNPRKLKCGINKMTKLSNNTLRLEFDSEKERDVIIAAVNKTKDLTSEVSRKKRPLLIIKGVHKNVKEGELIEAIVQQNENVANVIKGDKVDDHIKVRFKRRNRNIRLDNYVIEVSPGVRHSLIDLGRVNVEYQRVHVSEFSSFVQCYKCFGFGHTTKHCSLDENQNFCGHCAGDHKTSDCTSTSDKSKIKCVNCSKSNVKFGNQEPTSHVSTSKSCPHVIKMQQRAIDMTDYGC